MSLRVSAFCCDWISLHVCHVSRPAACLSLTFPSPSKIIHALALVYVVYTAIVFNLPVAYPITKDNFNYNPIGVGIFIVIFVGWWVIDARRWFRGPDPMRLVDKSSSETEQQTSYAPKGMGKLFQ